MSKGSSYLSSATVRGHSWEPLWERFALLHRKDENGCWLWIGKRLNTGYGIIQDGKPKTAHRVSWTIHRGNIPDGLCVCHTCDVRHCVNPEHLFLGSNKENCIDSEKKFRRSKKLTPGIARQIREENGTHAELASKYGCSKTLIYKIKVRRIWKFA